jgi:hypothetical protein
MLMLMLMLMLLRLRMRMRLEVEAKPYLTNEGYLNTVFFKKKDFFESLCEKLF